MSKIHHKKKQKAIRVSAVFVLIGVIGIGFFQLRTRIYCALSNLNSQQVSYDSIQIAQVIDGDTVELANHEKVRLIGIDTPELYDSDKLFRDAAESGVPAHVISVLGKQAHLFAQQLCERRTVKLEFGTERKDKYGRLLAFIFLEDGRMANEEIIKAGYAFAYLRFPFREDYRVRFREAEKTAKQNKAGLWKGDPGLSLLEKIYR
ncbi:thermonuclease family protein [bacterium]|nr:thermonuclease family protein [bacterium]MCP5461787.1 thermonuclease family protein [bacterium]